MPSKRIDEESHEQEEHADDCGSDCGPIEEQDKIAALTVSLYQEDRVEASFFDDISFGSPIGEMYNLDDGNFEKS